ncbi:MAG: TAT-variant-translocated molybdopterin oxidoreductase [Thermoanaerobaculia bacterium]
MSNDEETAPRSSAPSAASGPALPGVPPLDLGAVRAKLTGAQGSAFWQGIEEVAETPGFQEFLHREFPRQAAELPEGFDRRRFLELSAASLALGGLTACTRQPRESIVPYVRQPEEIVPGNPLSYATAITTNGTAMGVLVTSHMGRPTKIEGNPDHPASLGATDAFTQAALLTLYDPERSQVTTKLGDIRSWDSFSEELQGVLTRQAVSQGAGLRILTETVVSPTLFSQLQEFTRKFPKARWHQWGPSGHNARSGAQRAFGSSAAVRYDLAKADVVLALDADFLNAGPGSVRYARDFAERRRPGASSVANRLYVLECMPSGTGSVADHRLPASPSALTAAVQFLAAELGVGSGTTAPVLDAPVRTMLTAAAADLKNSGARALVVAGPTLSPAAQVLVHAINQALGNGGQSLLTTEAVEADPVDQAASLRELVQAMAKGEVEALVVLDANPVFTAPCDLSIANAFQRVPFRVHFGLYADETAEYCDWHVPEAHALEAWSDTRAYDGTISIVQPLIEPLYQGKSSHELLAALLGQPTAKGADIIRESWRGRLGAAGFDAKFRRLLHDGFVPDSTLAPKSLTVQSGAVAAAFAEAAQAPAPGAESIELNLQPDPTIGDGRFAGNAWLQELPKPVSKLVWDNAVLVAPALAQRLGLQNDQVVRVTSGGCTVEGPVFIVPGHADRAATLHFGYGRTRAGKVGTGKGFNVYPLRNVASLSAAPAATLLKTTRTLALVSTQLHWSMEDRHPVRVGTVAEFQHDPEFIRKEREVPPHDLTLYPDFPYSGYAWGMSIDLSSCTACNACVVACQAENNIPVVGKAQVAAGREMHWIRIDRYFEGELDNPRIHHQPMMCVHCENAPCEVVCPVAATSHSDEGLNVMTYNRCVGTRYCSNNCPYKVRRFNFFQYSDTTTPVTKLMQNPDVTVRNRGVMEKCTYCVQRIDHARIDAERGGRRIKDGELKTACQQACPSRAIVFGDINDKASLVTRRKADPLDYGVLEEINTRPRTTYLARLRNPNPALEAPGPEKPGHERKSGGPRHPAPEHAPAARMAPTGSAS